MVGWVAAAFLAGCVEEVAVDANLRDELAEQLVDELRELLRRLG